MRSTTYGTARHLISFANRLAYATLFAFVVFVGANLPLFERGEPVSLAARLFTFIVYVLDYPVAVVSLLEIPYLAGIDLFFGKGVGGHMGLTELLLWHLRVSVPVYLVLSYLPSFVRAGWQALHRGAPGRAPEGSTR